MKTTTGTCQVILLSSWSRLKGTCSALFPAWLSNFQHCSSFYLKKVKTSCYLIFSKGVYRGSSDFIILGMISAFPLVSQQHVTICWITGCSVCGDGAGLETSFCINNAITTTRLLLCKGIRDKAILTKAPLCVTAAFGLFKSKYNCV